jgi:hypothetical protein
LKIKALIITYYWPPAGGPGVQRWLKLSNYLLENNIKPIVYTPSNAKYPSTDKSLLNEVYKGIEVIRSPIFEPFSFFNNKKINSIRRGGIPKREDQSLFDRFMIYIRGNMLIPDSRIFWIKPSVKFLSKHILEKGIDIIITTGPPHSLHLIGLDLKSKLDITWFADFRDPWTRINYHNKLKLTSYAANRHLKLESDVLNSSDRVIVTSNRLLNEYRKKTNTPVSLITNGFDYIKKEMPLDNKFSITHIGSLLPERNPQILWKALREIALKRNNFKDDLVINFIGKVNINIKDDIKYNHLENNVVYHNYIEYKDTIPNLLKSQILLLIEADNDESSFVIPAKIFEYINSSRPIIAIGPKDSEVKHIINKTKSGKYFLYDEYEEVLKYIEDSYELYKIKKLKIKSINIDQYHRKNLAKKLSNLIFKETN